MPIAGLLAVALVLVLDAVVFRVFPPWQALATRLHNRHYGKIFDDYLALEELARGPDGRRRVVLLGTSRMKFAWKPDTAESTSLPESLQVLLMGHSGVYATEIRAAAEALRDRVPDVVVFGISEVDTHIPVRLSPKASFPSAHAYLDLSQYLGWGWVHQEREGLYRTVLGGVVLGYRYRAVLGRAALDRARQFADTRHRGDRELRLDAKQQQLVDELVASDTKFSRLRQQKAVPKQVLNLAKVAAGPHTGAHMAFLRSAVEILHHAGSEVLIIELPLYPGSRDLYDAGLRAEFLAFADALGRDFGVRTIRLEEQPTYTKSDFADITHLGTTGAEKLTGTLLAALLENDDSRFRVRRCADAVGLHE